MYVEFADDKVKELFDDLNDVRGSRNLMIRAIGADLTRLYLFLLLLRCSSPDWANQSRWKATEKAFIL